MNTYHPLLPKTSSTTSLIIVDVNKDKRSSLASDVLNAIFCFQGLINRQTSQKIYLTSVPIRNFPEPAEMFDGQDPARLMLADQLIPFPYEEARLDLSQPWPALHFLLQHYRHLLKGKIICANTPRQSGSVCAAMTAAAFEDALVLTPELDQKLVQLGLQLPVIAELQAFDNITALQWSMSRYLHHPKRNRQLVGFHWAIQNAVMADYWIATYTFCYYLERADYAENRMFAHLLDPANYPPATPNMGAVEGTKARLTINNLGYRAVCGHIPNGSVTASIPTDPGEFHPAPSPQSVEIRPDGIYLAWVPAGNGADADALDFGPYLTYPSCRFDSKVGAVPLGLRINPYYMDLFPSLWAWFTRLHPQTTDLVAAWDDAWIPKTRAGQTAFAQAVKHHIEHANHSIQVLNIFNFHFFEHYTDIVHETLGHLEPHYIIRGYDGRHYHAEFTFPLWN
ncbi:MAG: hypothetical protein D6820_01430, partial [Lentisphaerae bacterium]